MLVGGRGGDRGHQGRGSPHAATSASSGRSEDEVAAGAGHRQRCHVVLERTDVAAGKELQVRHRPLQVEVRVVLPGEPDATEDLDALLGAVRGRVERHRAGDAGAEHPLAVMRGVGLAPGRCRVPGHRGTLLDGHQHVGQRVLDGLELADGPAELHAHLGVVGRRLEAPAGQPGALRRGQREGQRADLVTGHPDLVRGGDGEHRRRAARC